MIFAQAEAILEQIFDPLPVDDFFAMVGRESLNVTGGSDHARAHIFGLDPEKTVLDAFATHADQLDCHTVNPLGPPPVPVPVPDAEAFRALIASFHDRNYTVRVPEVLSLSPALQLFARALEYMLHQPVSASVFWSAAGANANVHYDDRDNIIIQLSGKKRWFISTDPPRLQNPWKDAAAPLPQIDRHRTLDVAPGDLVYIPRGTSHTVESLTDSLHVSVLFVPITVREAMLAALDHLSDLDRTFRETGVAAIARMTGQERQALSAGIRSGFDQLVARCGSDAFIDAALQRRSSRAIGDLPRPGDAVPPGGLTPETFVRHHPLAFSHLLGSAEVIDFSQPGGHIFIHRGAEEALQFIRNTPRFRIRDIAGGLSNDVRIALVSRLIMSGFLEPDE